MTNDHTEVPVHDSLEVHERQDFYQHDEWWKSVIQYQHEKADNTETAVYLWHNDGDGWSRKNKYVIKTPEAWRTDREIIDSLFQAAGGDGEAGTDAFPVSDYYTVAAGMTVFQSDHWWKAILNVVEKGNYETDEVMVYLWQKRDEDWRRRQKYTIKGENDWEEERAVIAGVLGMSSNDKKQTSDPVSHSASETTSRTVDMKNSKLDMSNEFAELNAELEAHLSETIEE